MISDYTRIIPLTKLKIYGKTMNSLRTIYEICKDTPRSAVRDTLQANSSSPRGKQMQQYFARCMCKVGHTQS